MSSRNNVLRKVEHVLRSVGWGHQARVQVVQYFIWSLPSQLELHLTEQSHNLVNIGTLLEQ